MAYGSTKLPLPEDRYTVNAFELAFVMRHSSALGRNSKFESLLMQRGVPVRIRVGQTIEPMLPVLTKDELINIGVESLRHSM